MTDVVARLLGVKEAAAYLGLSTWSVRDLWASGTLPRVRPFLPNGRELRRLLFDKADLDKLVETWKDPAEVEPGTTPACGGRGTQMKGAGPK